MRSNNNSKLKAYVRFDGSGRIIPGSLILQSIKPKDGKWKEIDSKECCNYVPTPPGPTPFISVWRTSAPDESITLPYEASGQYAGIIDWGDGTTSENSYANITHTYAIPGDYTISILGETTKFSFYNTTGIEGNNSKIISVVQWGSQLKLNSTFGSQFISCTNLDLSGVSDLPNLAGATKLNSMFQNCTSLVTINRVSEWNVSSVTDMSAMFNGAILFDQNISLWNVSNVTNMLNMFNGASSFNNGGVSTINNWNTSKVINMFGLFQDAISFNQSIGLWNVTKVTDMSFMFSGTPFNQPIGSWNVSNVTNMQNMFASSDFNQDINAWNVGIVTDMTSMFQNASAFNQDLSGWCVLGFPIEPTDFSTGATSWILSKPVWGTCSTAFTSVWRTTSPGEAISLPYNSTGVFTGFIDWGDGTVTPNTYADRAHSYAVAGDYTVQISGRCGDWSFGSYDPSSNTKLISITQWGTFVPESTYYMFYNCGNLDLSAVTDVLDLSLTNGLSYMFYGCIVLTTVNRINEWDVSNVTNMIGMFVSALNFNQNIGSWNVSKVTNMSQMFYNATAFNQNISSWDVSKVTDMSYMFYQAYAFNQPIGSWDVSNVTNMSGMFWGATAFNEPIGSWDVGSVTNMNYMFQNATAFTQDISSWNVINVTTMSSMFNSANTFNQAIGNWNVSNVTNMSNMFGNATAFNQPLASWNTSNVTDMSGMFQTATVFNQNIGSWNTSKVTTMSQMFTSATAFNGNIGAWDVSNVTNMNYMFGSVTAFNQNIGSWNVSNVTNMANMFDSATVFNQNIGSWNVSKVTTMSQMFTSATAFNQDISLWNVSNVTNMVAMFQFATAFNQNIGSWNTSKVTNMSAMFLNALAFNQPIGAWNVGSVTSMGFMFYNAILFNQDLSDWCVLGFPIEPADFDTGATAWVLSRPIWGTCSTAFTSLWRTTTASESITLPYRSSGVYSGFINWGDGTTSISSYSNRTHTYSVAGDYTVQITGRCGNWSFGNTPTSATKLRSITKWGSFAPEANVKEVFLNCINLDLSTVSDVLNLSLTTTLDGMFASCILLTTVNRINEWNVSNITDMPRVFYNSRFNQDISSWNVGNVTNMFSMFNSTPFFNQPIGSWDVSKVTIMSGMFSGAQVFNQNLNSWNVGNVTNMNTMFGLAYVFNQPLDLWDVSKVFDMSQMFYNAPVFNQDLSGWCVTLIPSLPTNFSTGATAWTLPKPVWGTCPA